MIIHTEKNRNSDHRRRLVAFRPQPNFPSAVEVSVITLRERAELGGHSHPYSERFVLASGVCRIRTWTRQKGVQEVTLNAPAVFEFEAGEEHSLDCTEYTVLVSFAPVAFAEENIIPGIHL